jgi:hypothetical protein
MSIGAARVEFQIPPNHVAAPQMHMVPWSNGVQGFIVHNNSTSDVIITNGDNNRDAWTVPGGTTQTFNPPNPFFSVYGNAVEVSAATGVISVELYSIRQPLNNNPNQQLLPGTQDVAIQSGSVTILGSPTVTLAPGQNVGIVGTPNVNIAGSANVNIVAQSLTLATADGAVGGNTAAMLGLLTRFRSDFTLTSGQVAILTLTAGIIGFGLTSTIIGAGRLNIWISGSVNPNVYLVRNRSFYGSPLTQSPIEKRFAVPIKTGDAINIAWDDAITSAAFTVRY